MTDLTEPMIEFNGQLIPAHEAWRKMETATVATEILERFNKNFPDLATPETLAIVPIVRRRLREVAIQLPPKPDQQPSIKARAVALLESESPEATLDILAAEFHARIDMPILLGLIGEAPYFAALSREADEFQQNKISSAQTADLWNEIGRPAPGGGHWTTRKVEKLQLSDASNGP